MIKYVTDYLFEIREGEDLPATFMEFTTHRVESSQAEAEAGMRNVAIEIYFNILDSSAYEMDLRKNFEILLGEESYRPVQTEIIEVVGLHENGYLLGVHDGEIKAILEYVIPDHEEGFDLWFNSNGLGPGIIVKFD